MAANCNKGRLRDPGPLKTSSRVLQHLTQRRQSRFTDSCTVEAGEKYVGQEDEELAQKAMNPRQLEVLTAEPRKGPAALDGAGSVGDTWDSVHRIRCVVNRDS